MSIITNLLLVTPTKELLITRTDGSISEFTTDTLNKDYEWKIYVTREELERNLEILNGIEF